MKLGIIVFLALSQAQGSWNSTYQAEDKTDAYQEVYRDLDKSLVGSNLLRKLAKVKVILVRGYAADRIKYDHSRNEVAVSYFKDQKQWLENAGVEFDLVGIQSGGTLDFNASQVAESISNSTKPVVLIGHSQGGLSVLHALVKNPGLIPKVKGAIAIQSPFSGTPIVDVMNSILPINFPTKLIIELVGGTPASLMEFSPKQRFIYNRDHAAEIKNIVSKVPFYCFGSFIDEKWFHVETAFEIPRNIMLMLGLKNDGLVPFDSAILEGSKYVELPQMDHLDPVSLVGMSGVDRYKLTQAVLTTLALDL